MRPLFIICVLLVGWITSAFADLDEARFQGHTSNFRYDVWMPFKPAPPAPRSPDAPKYWTVFDTLRVIINGREINAPKAALEDLFWPHPSGDPFPGPDNTLRVPVSGGSGEYAYEAVLVFSRSRFLEVERRDHGSSKWKVIKYGVR